MRLDKRVLGAALALAAVVGGSGRREALAIDGVYCNPSNGHYYKLIPTPGNSSWAACKAAAESLGGYLATMTSQQETDWVTSNFTINWAFLGGTDAASEGNWVWVTGEPWAYTNWDSLPQWGQQPDNNGGVQHWIRTTGSAGKWDDVHDTPWDVDSYLVEWDSDPNAAPPKDPPAAPSALVASVTLGNPIRLGWKDNSTNEEVFQIERRTATTGFFPTAEVGPNTTAYEDVSTEPSVEYFYRVRALNSGGASAYTNEASATSSALIPAPKPPGGLAALEVSHDSVELFWYDMSNNEIGFEVHRRTPDGNFAFLGSTPANTGSYMDTGLPPDTDFVYGVRSVSIQRASFFAEVEASTLPTLWITTLRGDLKDSPKFGKDSLKVQALFDFLPASPDGLFDLLAEGITLRAGDDAHPVVMTLPGGLDTWKVKGTKATWKSAKGSTPKYMVQVDLEDRLVKASAAGLELAAPPANPMRVSVGIGNDAGTARGDWEAKKPGYFRLR